MVPLIVSSCETGQALHWTNQYIHRTAAKSLHITTMGRGGVITILSLVLAESLLTELEALESRHRTPTK